MQAFPGEVTTQRRIVAVSLLPQFRNYAETPAADLKN
jgi:hypothetical protein